MAVAFVGRRDLCQLPRLLVLGRGLAGRSRTAAALGCWCLSAVLSSRAQDSGRSGPTVSSIGTLLRQSGVARSSCQPSWCRLPCPASWLRRRLLPRRRPANTLRQPRNWKWCGRHWPTRCGGECSPSMHSGDCGALPTFCRSTYGMVSFGDRIWACPMPECVAHATWRRHPPKSTGGDRCSAGGLAGLCSCRLWAVGTLLGTALRARPGGRSSDPLQRRCWHGSARGRCVWSYRQGCVASIGSPAQIATRLPAPGRRRSQEAIHLSQIFVARVAAAVALPRVR